MKKYLLLTILWFIAITFLMAKEDNQNKPEENKVKPKIVFIELGSVNCIPCKMMQPVMKEIEEMYPETVEVRFHDVWTKEGKEYGNQYKIKLIPTQVFLDEDGKEFFRHEGFFSKEEIVKLIENKLNEEKK